MCTETKLRLPSPFNRQNKLSGLRTRSQIELFREREAARRDQAERREVDAKVRHLNFELAERIVFLLLAVGIGISVIVGALGNPDLLALAIAAGGAWGGIAVAQRRQRVKSGDSPG